jgi:DNA helicase II / ATP-dependent DNA helicase PcrA
LLSFIRNSYRFLATLIQMSTAPNLTDAQQEAILHNDGPCLVVAGAGTGKTRVITERIAHLVLEHKIDPEQILALTFTDKAAGEMQERVDEQLPYGMFGTTIGTFHSFCHELQKRHAFVIGVDPNARLISKAEAVSLLRVNLSKLPLRHHKPPANPVTFLRNFLSFLDRAKEDQITPEQLRQHGQESLQAATSEADQEAAEKCIELAECMAIATTLFAEANVLTYADLIANGLAILRQSPHALRSEQDQFRYILIDEFQDTNRAQAELCYLLAGDSANIFVVGDDDQSIYRFRGASITNILQFRERYPQAKLITLRDNFRSSQPILDTAYRLIQQNNPHRLEVREGIDKRLIAHTEIDYPVKSCKYSHGVYEQEGVADKIQQLITEEGYRPEEIAILARAHNHLDGFEQELKARGIATIRHRDGSFYELPVVEQALAFVRFLVRPHDSFNLFFLLSEPPFACGVQQLREYSVAARKVRNSLWEQLNQDETLTADIAEAVWYLREKLEQSDRRPTDALRDFITTSGWQKQLVEAEDVTGLNALNTLYQEARSFEQLHRPVVMAQYVHHLDELIASNEEIRVENLVGQERAGVHLMTIHLSKGLEFRAVFVVNLVQGRFPGKDQHKPLPMPEELVTPQVDQVKYEEERRLAYVAFTRAKERLFLTRAVRYENNKRDKKLSPFLIEALELDENEPILDTPLHTGLPTIGSAIQESVPLFQPPTVYSASALESFDGSPESYLHEHVYRLLKDENQHTSFGTCVHAVLFGYLSAQKAGATYDLEAEYLKLWRSEGYESKEQEAEWKSDGLISLKRYLAALPLDFQSHLLEANVELTLESGVKVIGKVDRIDRDPDGTLHIIDYKTGRKEAKQAKVRENLPIAIYAAALAQRGEQVGSVNLHYLMTGQQLSLAVDEAFISKTLNRVNEIITEIEEAYRTNHWPAREWYG